MTPAALSSGCFPHCDRSPAACRCMPACSFGRLGLDCRACTQGPCRISPLEGRQDTVCGRDRDALVAENFLRLIADSAATNITA